MMFSAAGGSVEYELQRKKVKNMRIRVTGAAKVVVSAPLHAPAQRIQSFVEANSQAIASALNDINGKRMRSYPPTYSHGEGFLYLGEKIAIALTPSRRAFASLDGSNLFLHVPISCPLERRRQIFIKWAKSQAAAVFSERAKLIAPRFSLLLREDVKISVRNTLTRWGSINIKNQSVSLSVHLLRCDTELIDYIIAHELCHLAYSGHSRGFYRELEKHFPHRKELDKRLRAYGLVDFS